MARVKLNLPDHFDFKTEIVLRPTDMARDGRLGNDMLISLMNEARVKFYDDLGYREGKVAGARTVVTEAVVVYKSEGCAEDILAFEMAAADFSRTGCDLYYRVCNVRTRVEVARAKTAIHFLDAQSRKVIPVPEGFRSRFSQSPG